MVSEKVECICLCFFLVMGHVHFVYEKREWSITGLFGCYGYFRCWLHWFVDWIFKINLFNWRLITLQYCGGFCHTLTWSSHWYTCVHHLEPPSHLLPHPIPLGCPSAPALSALFHASNLDWSSMSCMVKHTFQWYSLKSSHPCLLPQSPKVCSLYLCLFCCLAHMVIITIFLNSIYMHYYIVLVFLFLTYLTLYNRLQFHPPH